MWIIDWALSQLVSYSLWAWLLFVAIAFIGPYLLHAPGVLLGHVVIAIAVAVIDVQWVQSEIRKPEWNPTIGPDQDFVFMIGVFLRVLLVNAVLFPINLLGFRRWNSHSSPDDSDKLASVEAPCGIPGD